MSANIINAIINICNSKGFDLKEFGAGRNRMISMGTALEEYIKNCFANTLNETDEEQRMLKQDKVFSWLGNANNLPDAMILGGPAIEIKKLESFGQIQLNSSYPKAYLTSDNPKIAEDCRNCSKEKWSKKEMIYAVGNVKGKKLNQLSMIYGDIYAADSNVYTRIESAITDTVHKMEDTEFAKTNELARINRIDPLGITNLRVRGMWLIDNPIKVYDYLYKVPNCTFSLFCLIRAETFELFPNKQDLLDLAKKLKGLSITDKKVKNPNNKADLVDVKMITYTR